MSDTEVDNNGYCPGTMFLYNYSYELIIAVDDSKCLRRYLMMMNTGPETQTILTYFFAVPPPTSELGRCTVMFPDCTT
jgi:hypothetical protein